MTKLKEYFQPSALHIDRAIKEGYTEFTVNNKKWPIDEEIVNNLHKATVKKGSALRFYLIRRNKKTNTILIP